MDANELGGDWGIVDRVEGKVGERRSGLVGPQILTPYLTRRTSKHTCPPTHSTEPWSVYGPPQQLCFLRTFKRSSRLLGFVSTKKEST